jgi:hypothetical protein
MSNEFTECEDAVESTHATDRRQFIRTAAGVLVPSAIGLALGEQAGSAASVTSEGKRRRRKRRARRNPPQMFADDVAVNFRHTFWHEVSVQFYTMFSPTTRKIPLAMNEESGFNRAVAPKDFATELILNIHPGRGFPHDWRYKILFENVEIGLPDVTVERQVPSKFGSGYYTDRSLLSNHDLSENAKVDCDDGVVRIHIHRWTDGTIAEDEHDEEYCRFYATIGPYS